MIAVTHAEAGFVTVCVLAAAVILAILLATIDEILKARRSSTERARLEIHAARTELELLEFQASVKQDARRLRRELLTELEDSERVRPRPSRRRDAQS